MKTLANLKLSNSIRTSIINFCESYREASSENPTIGVVASAFGVPNMGFDSNETVTESFIRRSTIFLAEGILNLNEAGAGVLDFVPRAERIDGFDTSSIEAREREGTATNMPVPGASRLTAAGRDVVQYGVPPETVGFDQTSFDQFINDASLDELEAAINNTNLTASGSTPTDLQLKLLNLAGAKMNTQKSSPVIDSPVIVPPAPSTPPSTTPPPNQEDQEDQEDQEEITSIPGVGMPGGTETDTGSSTETDRKTKLSRKTEVDREIKARLRSALASQTETGVDTDTESGVEARKDTTPSKKPKEEDAAKEGSSFREPRGTPTKSEKQERPKTASGSSGGSKGSPFPPGTADPSMSDVRYSALIARANPGGQGSVVLPIYESGYDPGKSVKKKGEKQQYKVVVSQEGGKKVEIFAKSIRGIKRAVYGKKNYRVFDSKGTDITNYFKRMQKKGK